MKLIYLTILLPLIVQLSFQLWTKQMQEILSAKKRGDTAFREKDFKEAILSYTQVPNYHMLQYRFHSTSQHQPSLHLLVLLSVDLRSNHSTKANQSIACMHAWIIHSSCLIPWVKLSWYMYVRSQEFGCDLTKIDIILLQKLSTL